MSVSVIIPIYNSYPDAVRCINSVIASRVWCHFHLIIIDDASTDHEVQQYLSQLECAADTTVISHTRNLGFPRSINEAIDHRTDSDVVILNSDTVVFGDWLARLCRHSERRPDVATVTPLSNNGSLYSYPGEFHPGIITVDEAEIIDTQCRYINDGKAIEIPVGVGFCMWISRTVIQRVGNFDADTFGRGYGEETDFCLRAAIGGYTNLLACDVFVWHFGGASFGRERYTLSEFAYRAVVSRHPTYPARLHRFIESGTLQANHALLDLRRIIDYYSSRNVIIFISHVVGGGIERSTSDLAAAILKHGYDVLMIRIENNWQGRITINQYYVSNPILLSTTPSFSIETSPDLFGRILISVSPIFIHIHSLYGLRRRGVDVIYNALKSWGGPFYYTWHDYLPVCPRATFTDGMGSYCGAIVGAGCESCVRWPPVDWVEGSAEAWRSAFGALLKDTTVVFAPSQDTFTRVTELGQGAKLRLRPHIEAVATFRPRRSRRDRGQALRVAVVGAIGAAKGADVLVGLIADVRARNLSIKYQVVGYTEYRGTCYGVEISETGAYRDEVELVTILNRLRPDIALYPSIWPETYGYVISELIRYGVPPVVFDIGAPAERLRNLGIGVTLDPGLQNTPAQLNDMLLSLDVAELRMLCNGTYLRTEYVDVLRDYYSIETENRSGVSMPSVMLRGAKLTNHSRNRSLPGD